MAALAAVSAAAPAAAAAPAFMAGLDPEASCSESRCQVLLRRKIGTSPSLIKNAVSPEMHSVRLAPARPWSSSRHPQSAGAGQAPPAPPWCARQPCRYLLLLLCSYGTGRLVG